MILGKGRVVSLRFLCNLKFVLIVALLVRILMAFAVDRYVQNAGRQFLIEGDANGYWELAQRIASGQDYCIHQPPRYVLRTPGFPLLLAASIKVLGPSILAARLVLAFIGAAACWLTCILARQWIGQRAGLVAAGIMAISPLHVGNSVLILSETLFSFSLLCCLVLISGLLRQPATPAPIKVSGKMLLTAIALGVVTGLTVLVRPGWILWSGVSCLIVMLSGIVKPGVRLWLCGLMLLGCFTALLPWAYRNYTVCGHWVFTSLWSGPSLYDGLHPAATGASDMTFVDQQHVFEQMNEYDANAHYKRLAFAFAWDNKLRTLQLAFIKMGRYLSPGPNADGFSRGPVYLTTAGFNLLFGGLVLWGGWVARRRLVFLAVVVAPFLQFLLVHMVFVGSIRYRLPVEYPLSLLAAIGVCRLFLRESQMCDPKVSEERSACECSGLAD